MLRGQDGRDRDDGPGPWMRPTEAITASRELPPYAVQPPGASFERTVSRKQYLVMFRETLARDLRRDGPRPVPVAGDRLGPVAGADRSSGRGLHPAQPGPAGPPVPGGRRPPHAGPADAAVRQPARPTTP